MNQRDRQSPARSDNNHNDNNDGDNMTFATRKTLVCLAVAGAWTATALAQEAPKDSGKVEEVVVSATRYSTSLLKTPVAVSAFNQDYLDKQGVTSISDLSGDIPNVVMNPNLNGAVQITIRGVTSNDTSEISSPSVGYHVDGMYSPRPQGAQALMFDLEQVEVLRGPQGTLFGRNSTAGSINIITAKPDFSGNYGKAQIDLGNYKKRQLNVIQNIAVNDSLALRATFMKVLRDGYANQTSDTTEANFPAQGWVPNGIPDVDQRNNRKVDKSDYYTNQKEWAARLGARLKVNKDVTLHAAYEQYQDSGAGGSSFRDCDASAGTKYDCNTIKVGTGGGKWDLNVNVPGSVDMTMKTMRSGINWKLNDNTEFDYNFAGSLMTTDRLEDGDRGMSYSQPWQTQGLNTLPLPAGGSWGTNPLNDWHSRTQDAHYWSTVHEAQLKQRIGNVQYVGGLFSMNEHNRLKFENFFNFQNPYGDPVSVFYNQKNQQIKARAAFLQADWRAMQSLTLTAGARYSKDTQSTNGDVYGSWDSATSGFYYNGLFNRGTPGTPGYLPHIESTDLTDAMGSTGGTAAYARYGAPSTNENEQSWRKITWRLGATWDISPSQMTYASVSTGYKAGGFGDKNDTCGYKRCADGTRGQVTYLPYGPESLINFELGYKGRFLDNRATLAVTAFYMRYKDMQQTGNYAVGTMMTDDGLPCPVNNPTCNIYSAWHTVNLGKVDIPGLEVEWTYKPTSTIKIGGNMALINTSIHDMPLNEDSYNCFARSEIGVQPCPEPSTSTDPRYAGKRLYNINGNHLPNTPPVTLSLNYSQYFNLDSGYTISPYVKANWRAKSYFTINNLDMDHVGLYQKPYTTVDAQVRIDTPERKWHFEAYVRNLTDRHAKVAGDSANGGYMTAWFIEPRMFGVRAGLSY